MPLTMGYYLLQLGQTSLPAKMCVYDGQGNYIEQYAMELLEKILVLQVVGGVLGKIDLAHGGDRLDQPRPVQLLHAGEYAILIVLALAVEGLLDLDDEGEVVLVAFGHVADHEVVSEESHATVDPPLDKNYKIYKSIGETVPDLPHLELISNPMLVTSQSPSSSLQQTRRHTGISSTLMSNLKATTFLNMSSLSLPIQNFSLFWENTSSLTNFFSSLSQQALNHFRQSLASPTIIFLLLHFYARYGSGTMQEVCLLLEYKALRQAIPSEFSQATSPEMNVSLAPLSTSRSSWSSRVSLPISSRGRGLTSSNCCTWMLTSQNSGYFLLSVLAKIFSYCYVSFSLTFYCSRSNMFLSCCSWLSSFSVFLSSAYCSSIFFSFYMR